MHGMIVRESVAHRHFATISLVLSALAIGASTARGGLLHKLTPNDAQPPKDFEFGVAVALDGDRALVGARVSGASGITGTGSAYVFNVNTGQQLAKLTASDSEQDDEFGYAVALSGNLALVGARFHDLSKGAAYVFDVTTGQQLHKLNASGYSFPISITLFGDSVALDGANALIGAPFEGAAYLFDAVTGQQIRKFLAPDDTAFSARFGATVALSGNVAIVQAPEHSTGSAAYVYDIATGDLLRTIPTPVGFNLFDAIGLDGNVALVRDRSDGHAGASSGAARVYDATTGQELHKLIASDAAPEDYFGEAVALNGNLALIAAPLDDGAHNASGSAYIFDVVTGQQLVRLTSPDDAPGSRFARSVALQGHTALIGGQWYDGNRVHGAAYLFDVSSVPEPATRVLGVLTLAVVIARRALRSRHTA